MKFSKFFDRIRHADNKRLISNFSALVFLRGADMLIPLITLPYLVRTIGIEKFGLINFSLSFAFYFGAIIQYGFAISATRDIARAREFPDELNRIFSATFWTSTFLVLISSTIHFLLVLSFNKLSSAFLLHAATMGYVALQSLTPTWFFQGVEKMSMIAWTSLITRVSFLLALFIFVNEEADFLLVPALNGTAALLGLIVALILVRLQIGRALRKPRLTEIFETLKHGRRVFVSQIAPTLYNNSATFLLGIFGSPVAVGIFSAATKVIDAASSFAYVLSNVFLPYLSRGMHHHRSFERLMLVCGIIVTILLCVAADYIAQLLFGVEAEAIAPYIQLLAISVLCIFVMLTYGTNYMMLTGREHIVEKISVQSSLFYFGLGLLLIPMFELHGAVVMIVSARATKAILFYRTHQKIQNFT